MIKKEITCLKIYFLMGLVGLGLSKRRIRVNHKVSACTSKGDQIINLSVSLIHSGFGMQPRTEIYIGIYIHIRYSSMGLWCIYSLSCTLNIIEMVGVTKNRGDQIGNCVARICGLAHLVVIIIDDVVVI